MSKDLSAEVDFLQSPTKPSAPSGMTDEVAESIAFASPRRAGLMMRTMALHKGRFISSDVVEEIKSKNEDDGTEQVNGASNILPAWFLEVGPSRSTAICKIEAAGTNYKGERGEWAGTGFLVSEDILLTNHHVLNSPEVARNGECIFNYQIDPDNHEMPVKRFRFDPDFLFITSPTRGGLDFTFVRVKGSPGEKYGRIPFNRRYYDINKDDVANIIHHPGGDFKCVTIQENKVIRPPAESVVHYASDTKKGSSGSCVFNNRWMPVALHHASKKREEIDPQSPYEFFNEGIRFSAIAAYLEALSGRDAARRPMIQEILSVIEGTDPITGFFGALGRNVSPETPGVEAMVNIYKGEPDDVDIAFWNIEHFEGRYEEKLEKVADVIAQMNLDIWAFEESSPQATQALADYLRDNYVMDFRCEFSEPNAPSNKQTTTVMWNTKTVKGKKEKWPAELDQWFRIQSTDFDSFGLENVEGKVFDRYPALFKFTAKQPNGGSANGAFDFYLVPLHLKAFDEGSKRRRMAAAIVGAAIQKMTEKYDADRDWIVGGDFNASLASDDFGKLISGGMVPLSAEDEQGGAISYVRSPKSMIDHIFLSANLADTYGAKDFFIVARDKEIPNYVKEISDHRPVLVRLSMNEQPHPESETTTVREERRKGSSNNLPDSLREALSKLDLDSGASDTHDADAPTRRAAPADERTININITIKGGEASVTTTGSSGGDSFVSTLSPSPSDATDEAVIKVDRNYKNRRGYDPDFLGTGGRRVPLPRLSGELKAKAAVNREARDGEDKYVLPYHHYSVVMNRERRLAFFSAVNINGKIIYRFNRKEDKDKWYFDTRLDEGEQTGNDVYTNNPLDRGHLVRRIDPSWGRPKWLLKPPTTTPSITRTPPRSITASTRAQPCGADSKITS